MIVVDASVVVTALVDDDIDGSTARDRLRGARLVAPELLDLEVLSVIRALVAVESLAPDRARQAIEDLRELRVERARHRPLIARCWELRHNLTPCDAAYVALAEALDTSLITGDVRLAQAPGPRCDIEVLVSDR